MESEKPKLSGSMMYSILYLPNISEEFKKAISDTVPISMETSESNVYELTQIEESFNDGEMASTIHYLNEIEKYKDADYNKIEKEFKELMANAEYYNYQYIEF